MTTYGQVCKNGHIMNHNTNTEWIAGENDYCETCGEEGITQCQECGEKEIKVSDDVLSGDADVNRSELPIYCGNCGDSFPWTGPSEMNRRGDVFIQSDVAEEEFYEELINQINRVYRVGADSATLVLVRKAIENAIVDILRNEYGMEDNELFYDHDYGRTRNLSELVSELNDSLDDLDAYQGCTNQTIIDRINYIKQTGDISAHSIYIEHTDEEIDDYSEKSEWTVRNLLMVKRDTSN